MTKEKISEVIKKSNFHLTTNSSYSPVSILFNCCHLQFADRYSWNHLAYLEHQVPK